MKTETSPLLWQPDDALIRSCHLTQFAEWLKEKEKIDFSDYHSFWEWSVADVARFWQRAAEYFEVQFHRPYEEVLQGEQMPFYKWFTGSTLNYAEHIFRMRDDSRPAIIFKSERHPLAEISWGELAGQVASMRLWLQEQGVQKGDRVVAYLPNIPEATIAFLATCSLGAIWSSCSPDFGLNSVVDRFAQIEPRVLFACDGYTYNGKPFDKREVVSALLERLPTVKRAVLVPFLDADATTAGLRDTVLWHDTFRADAPEVTFEPVPFEHPIWVLYSSGTTGIPKAITHCHGGNLLEHLKYLHFHNDVHPGERFFWYSTTGWMMWNFVQASMLAGATIVLYEGSPAYPDLNALWRFAEEAGITHFGTSAPFLVACMKQGIRPGADFDLSGMRSIGSTGAPLPPEAFDYVYDHIKKDVWLASMAGGTDVCTAWVGGNPWLPVFEGEIQCRCLGADLHAFDEEGRPVIDQVGELVVTSPMPSMPVFFWNDPEYKRYLSSYFEMYPGVWRHGDWIKVTSRGTVIIYGRSDATLNRHGVRIGTAEIYRAVDKLPEIADSLIVNLEREGGNDYMPLFVVMAPGNRLTDELKQKIKATLRRECSPRHVPDDIIEVPAIPYTISGKKMETPVKKILMGFPIEKAAKRDSTKNPEALDFFVEFAKRL